MPASLKKPSSPAIIRKTCLLLGAVVFAFLLLLYLFVEPRLLQDIEGRLLDARFQLRGASAVSDAVAVVAIDDASLQALGRWPWPRDQLAELITRINKAGAGVIGLDIVFAEPSENAWLDAVINNAGVAQAQKDKLLGEKVHLSPDRRLGEVIAQAGNVITGNYFYTDDRFRQGLNRHLSEEQQQQILARSAVTAIRTKTEDFPLTQASGVTLNIPGIAQAGAGSGFFNTDPGSDGIIRKMPLLIRYQDQVYPSLALQMLSFAMGSIVVQVEEYGVAKVIVGEHEILTDETGRINLNYRGAQQSIATYSALDVIQGRVPREAFQDRLVLLGVPAIGVDDVRATPFSPSFAGVEIQATALDNLIVGDVIVVDNLAVFSDIFTLLLMVALLSGILPRLQGMMRRTLFACAVLLLYLAINHGLFAGFNLWENMTYPLLAWLLSYSLISVYLGLIVERSYSSVRGAFKSYVHPGLVDRMVQNPQLLQLGGEQKELTVLFSDIRNFTNMSEQLSPPELAHFLNCYMDPMTEAVFENRGTLDKYIGDAVMAFFGAPYPSTQHPFNACQAALSMVQRLDHVKSCCPELSHIFPIRCGIGIHTGEVIVGNFGSSQRFNYTVLGDNVNLASRLEGMSKAYGVDIVVSDSTYSAVKDQFLFRELDSVRVKGKLVPVTLFELIGHDCDEQQAKFLEEWQGALRAYKNQQWPRAQQAFESLERVGGQKDRAVRLYLDRVKQYRRQPPPPAWDGVFTHDSK